MQVEWNKETMGLTPLGWLFSLFPARLSAPTDIPLQVRHEASLYMEHLAYTRRYFGPAHVQCMLASPSFCLYAAKAVIDVNHPQMIKRWLLVHGCAVFPATLSL